MHFSILALISMILAVVVTGEAPLKPVIVSFPNKDTPNSVYIQAKDAILEAVRIFRLFEWLEVP